MKNYKNLLGLVALVAIIAGAMCPSAYASKKKNNAKKAQIEALIDDGSNYFNSGNYQAAAKCFQKKGDIRGMHNLAVCYAEGKGVAQDYKKAIKLYEKAAKKNYIESQIELADMYIQGQGTKKDFKKAIKWLEKAAKQANVNASSASDAMYLIATCYFYGGNGIKKDLVKAKEWMQKSAALGNESAINSLPNLK